jgi:hypothetical protein
VVAPNDLPSLPHRLTRGHRLINSKFPPINLFDDVASAGEFEALYALQSLTNPRLQTQAGNLALLSREEIPFGITGCSYAVAPFTHVNPEGSRFSDGSFGILYLADHLDTAIAEVRYHQQAYWQRVKGLRYDRYVFLGLVAEFNEAGCRDALTLPAEHLLYHPKEYGASRTLGTALRAAGEPGLRYRSVRRPGAICWALLTPRHVASITQSIHLEMIWNGEVTEVNQLSAR